MTPLMTCIQLTHTQSHTDTDMHAPARVRAAIDSSRNDDGPVQSPIEGRIECASRLGQGCPEGALKRCGPLGCGSPCGCALNIERPSEAKGRCGAAAAVQKGKPNVENVLEH